VVPQPQPRGSPAARRRAVPDNARSGELVGQSDWPRERTALVEPTGVAEAVRARPRIDVPAHRGEPVHVIDEHVRRDADDLVADANQVDRILLALARAATT